MGTVPISILMSIYKNEKPEYLIDTMESILRQTIQPEEIFLVKDGPLTLELDEVIDEYKRKLGNQLSLYSLSENKGLGIALAEGVLNCRNELIARMDTDDIMVEDRLEVQYKLFKENSSLAIVGGNIIEFEGNVTNILGRRIVPESNEEIRRFSKRRNPFNHMTVMYKKEDIIQVGNYKPLKGFEDYYLWIRLLKQDKKAANINKILVYARGGKDMYSRRGGIKYLVPGLKARKVIYREGLGSFSDFIFVSAVHSIISLLPNGIRGVIYQKRLRNK